MFGFITRLFTSQDATAQRVENASERIAVAVEEIAQTFEAAARACKERMCVPVVESVIMAQPPKIEDLGGRRNGKHVGAKVK